MRSPDRHNSFQPRKLIKLGKNERNSKLVEEIDNLRFQIREFEQFVIELKQEIRLLKVNNQDLKRDLGKSTHGAQELKFCKLKIKELEAEIRR